MRELGKFRGTVTKYNVERKFGFIRVEEELVNQEFAKLTTWKDDAMIHWTEIEPNVDSFKKLLTGQEVEFELYRRDKGLVAKNLSVLGVRLDDQGDINYNN